ncbi:hypothetical protein ES703_121511 [subsurface metagenome]
METIPGKAQPEPSFSLLDIEDTSARKRSRRCYHRVMSGMEKKGRLRFLTLTTSRVGDNASFQQHFRQLRMRLLRRRLLLDYIRCPECTKSGLRHEHILFRGSYIEHAYISFLWAKLHNAPIVDIKGVWSRRGMAGYMAGYMAKSPAGRYSYSWGWVWRGFAKSWKLLKRFSREMAWSYDHLLTVWRWHVRLGIKVEEVIPP